MPPRRVPKTTTSQAVATPVDLPTGVEITLSGIVDPTGAGAVMRRRDRRWDFGVEFPVWRIDDQPPVTSRMRIVEQGITELLLGKRMKQFPRWEIVAFKGRFAQRQKWTYPAFELVKYIGPVSDRKLKTIRSELQKPITLVDRLFGILTYEPGFQQFKSEEIEGMFLNFHAENIDQLKEVVKLAKPFWRSRGHWFRQFKENVHASAFENIKSCWESADKGSLTKKMFLSHLGNPVGIYFSIANGELNFLLCGYSEELFGDHGVDVSGTITGGLTSA